MKDIAFSRRGLLATGVGSLVAALPVAEASAAPAEANFAEAKDKISSPQSVAEATSYIPGIIEFEIWSV